MAWNQALIMIGSLAAIFGVWSWGRHNHAPQKSRSTRRYSFMTSPRAVTPDTDELIGLPLRQPIKRCLDIVVSGILIVFVLPLMAAIALIIRLDSSGPAFFNQARVGRNGQTFIMLKFRTMRNAAEDEPERWALPDDPRVTRFGKWLRRAHLDELPQLFNIFKGDMSLVGPRPEQPSIAAMLAKEISDYPLRLAARPGLTGWAQVNEPYAASVEASREKLTYDLYYLRHHSLWFDIQILARTVSVVGEGLWPWRKTR